MIEFQAVDTDGKVLMHVTAMTMVSAREQVLENQPKYGNSTVMQKWRENDYSLRTVKGGTTLFFSAANDMYVGVSPKGHITPQDIRSYFKVARRMEQHVLSLSDWNDAATKVEITWNVSGDVDRAWISIEEAVESLLVTFNP